MNQENLYTPNSIRTFCGHYVDLSDPMPETIFPTDIAVGLSRICRFGGHTKKFYSVAEHSIECMILAEEKYPENYPLHFKVLMHDAHEAYLGDVVSPLKKLIKNYENIANKLQNVIHARFGISNIESDNSIIKEIDNALLEREWNKKVLNHTGIACPEDATVNLFIHHFVRLCKTPFVLQ